MMVQCNKSGEEYCRQNCFHAQPHENNVRCKGVKCEASELISIIPEGEGKANSIHVNSYDAVCVPV